MAEAAPQMSWAQKASRDIWWSKSGAVAWVVLDGLGLFMPGAFTGIYPFENANPNQDSTRADYERSAGLKTARLIAAAVMVAIVTVAFWSLYATGVAVAIMALSGSTHTLLGRSKKGFH